jgi:hypothetical protein
MAWNRSRRIAARLVRGSVGEAGANVCSSPACAVSKARVRAPINKIYWSVDVQPTATACMDAAGRQKLTEAKPMRIFEGAIFEYACNKLHKAILPS